MPLCGSPETPAVPRAFPVAAHSGFDTWRVCSWPGPSEVADDHVLEIRPGDCVEVNGHGPTARRPVGGRPEVVNDHIFKEIYA